MTEEKRKDYLLPASIIIAALLISGAWIYTAGLKNTGTGNGPAVTPPGTAATEGINIKPVSADDHTLGNPEAPLKIVEFSDLECPFCKSFHPTMKRVMQEYGKDGRVAWVYRHYPLDELHPKARTEAEASECASELGDNEKFWAYVDRVFAVTPSNNGLDLNQLPDIAEYVSLDKKKFQSCLDSGKYADKIKADVEDAQNAGARGTPYTVFVMNKKIKDGVVSFINDLNAKYSGQSPIFSVSSDGTRIGMSGALPYEDVKSIIEQVLK